MLMVNDLDYSFDILEVCYVIEVSMVWYVVMCVIVVDKEKIRFCFDVMFSEDLDFVFQVDVCFYLVIVEVLYNVVLL